jgi:hypothetical protein
VGFRSDRETYRSWTTRFLLFAREPKRAAQFADGRSIRQRLHDEAPFHLPSLTVPSGAFAAPFGSQCCPTDCQRCAERFVDYVLREYVVRRYHNYSSAGVSPGSTGVGYHQTRDRSHSMAQASRRTSYGRQDSRTIQELSGHSDVSATMIDPHVASKNKLGVTSPADALEDSGG